MRVDPITLFGGGGIKGIKRTTKNNDSPQIQSGGINDLHSVQGGKTPINITNENPFKLPQNPNSLLVLNDPKSSSSVQVNNGADGLSFRNCTEPRKNYATDPANQTETSNTMYGKKYKTGKKLFLNA